MELLQWLRYRSQDIFHPEQLPLSRLSEICIRKGHRGWRFAVIVDRVYGEVRGRYLARHRQHSAFGCLPMKDRSIAREKWSSSIMIGIAGSLCGRDEEQRQVLPHGGSRRLDARHGWSICSLSRKIHVLAMPAARKMKESLNCLMRIDRDKAPREKV